MIEAVFISDVHLHPNEPLITLRFHALLQWAATHTKQVYILGDLFHVWAGDDCLTPWSERLLSALQALSSQGVAVYFMHGNRDFLCGKRFAHAAGLTLLPDPSVIALSGGEVLLSHGDKYCLQDKAHQRFRRFTRNRVFIALFSRLPARLRHYLVKSVRNRSQSRRGLALSVYQVVNDALISDLQTHKINVLIHGHTHTPGLVEHARGTTVYRQYVLSDWDDIPQILCYDKSKGFEFVHLNEVLRG